MIYFFILYCFPKCFLCIGVLFIINFVGVNMDHAEEEMKLQIYYCISSDLVAPDQVASKPIIN